MERQESLLDLESDGYNFKEEAPAKEINCMVALIEEEVQSSDKNFLAAYKNIYF